VGEKTRDLRRQASDRAREQVDSRSTEAGEQLSAMADALRRTGSQLRQEGQGRTAGLAESVGERIERLGTYLRHAEADMILRDAESFARRRPWLVGAGGLLVGLAASRLLKASSEGRYGSNGDGAAYRRYDVAEPRAIGSYSDVPDSGAQSTR
jgi:hypothetical protein